jgi:hypothetical protein
LSIQTSNGTHRGVRVRKLPGQKVTGRPSTLLALPVLQAMKLTTRWVSRRWVSPWGSGP